MSTDERNDESTEKAGRRRVLVIAGLVVAVLVVAGVLTLVLTGGDDTADRAGEDRTGVGQTSAETTPAGQDTETATGTGTATEADVTAARGVAEEAAAAFASGDAEAMTRISCDPEGGETPVEIGENTTAELAGDPELSGDSGVVELRISIGGSEPAIVPLPLEKRPDGTWCVP